MTGIPYTISCLAFGMSAVTSSLVSDSSSSRKYREYRSSVEDAVGLRSALATKLNDCVPWFQSMLSVEIYSGNGAGTCASKEQCTVGSHKDGKNASSRARLSKSWRTVSHRRLYLIRRPSEEKTQPHDGRLPTVSTTRSPAPGGGKSFGTQLV